MGPRFNKPEIAKKPKLLPVRVVEVDDRYFVVMCCWTITNRDILDDQAAAELIKKNTFIDPILVKKCRLFSRRADAERFLAFNKPMYDHYTKIIPPNGD